MAVITFPLPTANPPLYVRTMRWERADQDVTMRGVFGVQSISAMAPLWKVGLTFDMKSQVDAGPYQALMLKLKGSRNQLKLYNVGRPTPLGTFTGASGATTFASTAAAGAASITLVNASYASKTLVAGDFIGFGTGVTTQVVMVTDTATSDVSGNITISVEPALRNQMTSGTSVTLQYPCALFRQQTNSIGWDYSTVVVDGMSLDLLEDFRA